MEGVAALVGLVDHVRQDTTAGASSRERTRASLAEAPASRARPVGTWKPKSFFFTIGTELLAERGAEGAGLGHREGEVHDPVAGDRADVLNQD
jgi:hypothetical protein